MAKELTCSDVGFDCPDVIRGETEEEVMAQASVHARDAHGIDEIDDETAQTIRSKIRDA